jgi:transposase InsO family protein
MDEETREAIALLRHRIISPVLMEARRAKAEYFREMAKQAFDVPGAGKKRFSASTMKGWLASYKLHGFKGLAPKARADRGQRRTLTASEQDAIAKMREDLADLSVAHFYRRALRAGALGSPPICQETLRRFLRERRLIKASEPKDARRRYEMSHFGELWIGDFMHGPELAGGVRGGREIKKKAILLAIIDDHSRMIVGHRWSFVETTGAIELAFKDAVLAYGKPDRLYVDNGPSFSSEYLRLVCAHLGVGLVHSKPYDSPSRGKIERFFRTVRECFLIDQKAETLAELSEQFKTWLRDAYHHRHHHGIDCRPIDRYQRSIHDYPRARPSEDALEELFMARAIRRVNKDATLSFGKIIFEAPAKYIGEKVDLRYRQDRPTELFLYEAGKRVARLSAVDSRANGRLYRPRPRDASVSYQRPSRPCAEEGKK